MGRKTIESVPVDVDEQALAPLGWTSEEVRARLVTEHRSGGSVTQRVAVAGTLRFRDADWTGRFSATGHAPHVLLTLNRRGIESLPSYGQAIAESAKVAAKRPIRFTETTQAWNASVPTAPEDLQIRLTGYDLDSVHPSFGLPGDRVAALPVTVLDQSTWPSLRVKVQASAEITREEYGEQLRVHAAGVVEPGPIEELLADRAAHDPELFDQLVKVPRLPIPGFVVEVSDDSDFLLAKHTLQLNGTIKAGEAADTSGRAARFVAGVRTSSAANAGTPAQIVLRVLDAADLRSL